MRRTASVLAILAFGWLFVFAPAAVAAPDAVGATTVLAQDAPAPPPGPELSPPGGGPQLSAEQRERYVIGSMGAALIGVVLLTRRLRGKPVFGFQWKKK